MGIPKQILQQQAEVEARDAALRAEAQQLELPLEGGEQPPAPPEPAPAPAPVPSPPPAEDPALWKQRFLSLQGMYNSQVPKLQQQIEELNEKLDKLKEAPPAAAPEAEKGKELTSSDVEAFGADLIDVIRRGAREQIDSLTKQYESRITALQGELAKATQSVAHVSEVQATSVQQSFFQQLGARLPTWEEVQSSGECQTWLGTRIPGGQLTWNDVLVTAADNRDVDAVMEVFDEFFSRHPNLNPRKTAAPTPPAPPRNRAELERQVTPAKTSASAPPANTQKRIYSSQDYADESMKVIRLMQQNKRAEADALELELNTALAEGRVKP